nr:hypothetical protein [uncultured Roseateles sp.]
MYQLLLQVAIRAAACALITYAIWRTLGTVALVVCAPLFGMTLARPILDIVAGLGAATKQAALAPLAGRHYEHHGIPIDIIEDESHRRWISLNDVRKVIENFPRDAVVRQQYPDGCRLDRDSKLQRISADALHSYLHKSTDPASLRFKIWLAREVVFPAEQVRRRLGIREPSDE